MLYAVIFTVINKIKRRERKMLNNQIIIAFVVTLFTLHPTLTKFLFGLYNCIEIDTGEYWLKN